MYLSHFGARPTASAENTRGLLGSGGASTPGREHPGDVAAGTPGWEKDRAANTWGGRGGEFPAPGWLGGQTAGRMGAGRGDQCVAMHLHLRDLNILFHVCSSSGKHPHPVGA